MKVHIDHHLPDVGVAEALDLTTRACRDVPAYREFLTSAGVDVDSIATVEDFRRLPSMTKENYLKRFGLNEKMWHGDVTGAALWSTSSGSTGAPTYFPRDERATQHSADVFNRIFTDCYRSRARSTLVIVAFAMGNWIAGTYSMLGMMELRNRNHRLSVTTPGMSIDEILTQLTDLGPHYEQVVLVGYPAFVKDVLDNAPAEVLAMDIKLQLAGQAITETWRDYVLDKLGRGGEPERVCLIYGTADAGAMGFETPVSIAARRASRADESLRDALFGSVTALPTFCEINTDERYVEADDGFLLFTIDAALPLIRYRINDQGWPVSGIRLQEVLRAYGHGDLAERVNPASTFVVLTGRSDVADTFYAVNIHTDNLAQAFEHPSVNSSVSGKFYVATRHDEAMNEVLDVHVELMNGAQPEPDLGRRLRRLCTATMESTNNDYRELLRIKGKPAEPVIKFHRFGSPRFAGRSVKCISKDA